jgi:hypothetical protein
MLRHAQHPSTDDLQQHFSVLSLQDDVQHTYRKVMISVKHDAPAGGEDYFICG